MWHLLHGCYIDAGIQTPALLILQCSCFILLHRQTPWLAETREEMGLFGLHLHIGHNPLLGKSGKGLKQELKLAGALSYAQLTLL